ncbi:COX15/CtaA family protein [Daejeonella sp.]|jgi:cytochrome c oxidase assembly protein subunit 15|uniref:COX15/CtaA family protein n=1 Tax=Daejeonella sp. TaxID=2805397 RepID=UPI0037850E44
MSEIKTMDSPKNNRQVVIWLFIGLGMIMIQVIIGGITRLTGSGLSITEWKPLIGAFPPMNEQAWQEAFNKYKEIAQFKHLNSHFSLADFKFIFFWEWLHRDWARLMGLVFIFPFIYFLIKKKIQKNMVTPLIVLFLLGALQGAIGWIMVQSGLNDQDLYVSHIRLAVHFMSALILLCYVLWFALKLSIAKNQIQYVPTLRKINLWLLAMLFFQLIYGAFMAGLHAALAARTWPDINGRLWPVGMLTEGGFLSDITHNLITVQFIHRGLAYLICIPVLMWLWKSRDLAQNTLLSKFRFIPIFLVFIQILLGVLTVLNTTGQIPLSYGILHQFVGMLFLLSVVFTLFLSRGEAAK